MDEIVVEFLIESREALDQVDLDLVALESAPSDRDLLSRIFRCVHTVKGTCGLLGFSKLEAVGHAGESLLVKLRDGDIVLREEITSALLALVDAIRAILATIEVTGLEGDADFSALVNLLKSLQSPQVALAAVGASSAHASSNAASSTSSSSTIATTGGPADNGAADGDADAIAEVTRSRKTPSKRRQRAPRAVRSVGEILVNAGAVDPADVAAAVQEQLGGNTKMVGEILVERAATTASSVSEAIDAQAELRNTVAAASESSIRVDVGLLDRLMNLVGELVLARNQIVQFASTLQNSPLGAASQRLNLLTTELQEGVMKTRMQPIGNLWSKFPRVVRDLAVTCNKQIRVEMEGKETELDKTIIEAIKDPLTHIVRNSADHGIETAETRIARGKPAEGCLHLRAYHEGGQVNIEIADDGAGIDPERLKAKAIERGLITPDHAARMGEREALQLIFLPGFSTAAAVTNISGRGVGMDVVRTNIEKIGGTVDLQSVVGAGTTLKIKIPLTLAIIPALIVTCGGGRYAIPQVNLVELVRREARDGGQGIETIHDAPVYRLRGNLLPIVRLHSVLGLVDASRSVNDATNIVVLQADGRTFGLVVDGISDTEEIVVKPLSVQLKGIEVFAGATIMGDGRVALILDVVGIAQRSDVISEHRERAAASDSRHGNEHASASQTLIVCGVGGGRVVAVPLSSVERLEEFAASSVEWAGEYRVVQYRGGILPLLNLGSLLNHFGDDEREILQVVVYTERGQSVGVIVGQIVDIVDVVVALDRSTARAGSLGSTVIQQRVTDVLDLREIVRTHAPWVFETELAFSGAAS